MANREEGYGLTAEIKAKIAEKYDIEQEQQVRVWMENVVGRPLVTDLPQTAVLGPDMFQAALKDGVYLCNLMNAIQPGSCKPSSARNAFQQMENIGMFLRGCENYGIRKQDLFQTVDLYDNENIGQVVLGIYALGRKCQSKGFTGPALGPKESTAATRHFTEEQLQAGKNIIPMQAGHSTGMDGPSDYGKRRQIMPDPGAGSGNN